MQSTPTLRDLFEAALALPAAERARLFAERGVDAATRAQVERMLDADATADEWITTGDAVGAADVIGEAGGGEPLPPGSRIGPFELIEVLGEGGSSTVFRAFRDAEGVRQPVAIKLLARGLYTAEAQRAFRHEREALARLRHPGIARLIEGGIADNGLAYIALELVDGLPITRHAQERGLPQRERLLLFLKVCRAVEAAHRALIVHRDLKPSNVLVTGEGEVKLLDFGIAKLLDDMDDATHTQHRALTPAYAAPEQFQGGVITTATDVYALGVVLRELLTGARAPPAHSFAKDRETAGETAAQAPDANGANARSRLRGDLANIVAKASAAEPERRYASAGALADDIERFLDRKPVRAHPPSRWYRAGRFVARHRGGVTVTAIFVLAILASWSVALWQAHVARQQAELARQQAARANQVRDFVESLFEPIRNGIAADKQPSLDTLLARGVEKLGKSPQLGPGERVDLLAMFSRLYENLGELPQSRKLADQAVALSDRTLRPSDINAIRALTARGYIEVRSEDFAAGGNDLRDALRLLHAQHRHGESVIDVIGPLALVENIQGHDETALSDSREELSEMIATWGPDDPRVGVGYNDVSSALEGLERYDEAAVMGEKSYRFDLAHFGRYSNETTLALAGWGSSEYRAGHWKHAHELFAQALAMYTRIGVKPEVAQVYTVEKACILDGLRLDRASAQQDCAQARALAATAFGADTGLYGDALETTAFGLVEQGDLAGAQRLYQQARKLYGDDPANRMRVGRVDSELAGIALLQGKPAVARELLPGAIAGLRTRAYKLPPLVAEARLLLACAQSPGPQCPGDLQAKVQHDLAEVDARGDPLLLWVHTSLAQVELLRGQPAQARARLARAIRRAGVELQPSHPRRLAAQLWLAVAAARSGDCAGANAQALDADAIIAANRLAAHPVLANARAALAQTAGNCGPAPH